MKLSDNLATIFKLVAVTKDFVAEADGQGATKPRWKSVLPFFVEKVTRQANGKYGHVNYDPFVNELIKWV